jgi:hypothetical protein
MKVGLSPLPDCETLARAHAPLAAKFGQGVSSDM